MYWYWKKPWSILTKKVLGIRRCSLFVFEFSQQWWEYSEHWRISISKDEFTVISNCCSICVIKYILFLSKFIEHHVRNFIQRGSVLLRPLVHIGPGTLSVQIRDCWKPHHQPNTVHLITYSAFLMILHSILSMKMLVRSCWLVACLVKISHNVTSLPTWYVMKKVLQLKHWQIYNFCWCHV